MEVDNNKLSLILPICYFDTWIGWLWYYEFAFENGMRLSNEGESAAFRR